MRGATVYRETPALLAAAGAMLALGIFYDLPLLPATGIAAVSSLLLRHAMARPGRRAVVAISRNPNKGHPNR